VCARFTLFTPGQRIAELFHLSQVPALTPRYNVAPSQLVAVIGTKAGGGGRGLALFRWGFIPRWANDQKGPKPVNAKAETIASTSAFRDSYRDRRCLIPTDGFYEWRDTPEGKKPLFYRLKGGEAMALAGIWDFWPGPTEKVFTCAIVTTAANSLVEPVHDRMPVILPLDAWDLWLDPAVTDPERLLSVLKPYPAEKMEAVPVIGTAVNNSRFEGPECLAGVT